MNELSFHAHPNADTDQLETGYSWPNAGIPNLARIKQAVWDAFFGTAQPTFEEAGMPRGPVRTLKMRLNEVGWQVAIPPASRGAYFGPEYGSLDVPVISRAELLDSPPREGPLIVEEYDATCVVPPGCRVTLDSLGNIDIALEP